MERMNAPAFLALSNNGITTLNNVQSCLLGYTVVSTRQYNPEDSSEHHTRRRESLKSHKL
jgi:hypothetical protein